MALLLKGWGLKVRVAHDGSEALREARACPPDAVLLDITVTCRKLTAEVAETRAAIWAKRWVDVNGGGEA